MNIKLENIGIIKNSEIRLDGLTVITGKNNSGKNAVGKILYSLIDSVSNIEQKNENDKMNYIIKVIKKIDSDLSYARSLIYKLSRYDIFYLDMEEWFNNYSKLYWRIHYADESYKRKELICELMSSLYNLFKFLNEYKRYDILDISIDFDKVMKICRDKIKENINFLQEVIETLKIDTELFEYTKQSIYQTLRIEFDKQLQPLGIKKSKIILYQNDEVFFDIDIENNEIVNFNDEDILSLFSYKKAYLIDNPFILDKYESYFTENENCKENEFLNSEMILHHNAKLKNIIKSKDNSSVLEKTISNTYVSKIKPLLDYIVPGNFEFDSDCEYYVKNSDRLSISNLEAGSKMFSIIKILLEKGEIDKNTMLILEEPQAYLYPRLQSIFAEVIVLLVKNLGVNILLTSNSPSFVLAIDTYIRKYKILDKTNFYQTKYLQDGMVDYEFIKDELENMYSEFMDYISELKTLRDKYYYK